MTSKASTMAGIFIFFTFIFFFFVAQYDYFTTPQFKILPFISSLFLYILAFIAFFGEYFGVFVVRLAKKNFITRGGLTAVYEGHRESHSGMVTYYFSAFTYHLNHCNVKEFAEQNGIQRFFTFLTPTRVYYITDKKEMFEDLSMECSDTPEGCVFYHGTLRGVKVAGFEDILRTRLQLAGSIISELWSHLLLAKAASEAASQGQNQKLVEVSTQLSTALENISRYQTQQPQQVSMQQPPRLGGQ